VKKMVCELCGSNAFTRDDEGLYACDYCRTKYTAEQAKSMLVEGVVSLDRTAEAAAAVRLGRRLAERSWGPEVKAQAKRALELDPENGAAWQLLGLCEHHQSGASVFPEGTFELARKFAAPEAVAGFEREQREAFRAFTELEEAEGALLARSQRVRAIRRSFLIGAVAAVVLGFAVGAGGNVVLMLLCFIAGVVSFSVWFIWQVFRL